MLCCSSGLILRAKRGLRRKIESSSIRNNCEEIQFNWRTDAIAKNLANDRIMLCVSVFASNISQKSMFWIGGSTRFLTRLLAGCCLVLSMFGPAVATEQPIVLQHGAVVSSTATAILELSDTAVYQIAHRLTQDNVHCKTLASSTRWLCGCLSQFNDFGCLADRSVSSTSNSLFHSGTMLRL